ncbi:MAG: J domain-containing protein [Clostridia bacterium]|jgi:curved DNA-binding protein|nr:J domain-containing protein [Clostridia bacterium]
MKYKDYYKLLGLETSRVSIEEIKIAYRSAAKKYHPDLNIGDSLAEERIKDINEAYRTLSVPASKRKYDRIWNSRNNVRNYQNIKGKNIFSMFLGDIEDNNKEDVDTKKQIKGEDIETEINVSLEDAFYGLEKKISLRTIEGNMKTFSVKIPEGIRDGEKIRLMGQGKKGSNGGKNGDLFIKIAIENSKEFKLYGSDLYTDLKLTPWEAVLGTRVDVKTIDGETKVYIPQGIQSGEKIKIPSKGYKDGQGGRGDLVAEVKIMVPKTLNLEEKEMYEKLKEMSRFNPRTC